MNTLAICSKSNKISIRLKEIFNHHICIHSITLYKERKHLYFPLYSPPYNMKTNLWIIPFIMPKYIVIVHYTPEYAIIVNNCRVMEFYWLHIYCTFLFLLSFWHSQTWKGWDNHNIIIRFLQKEFQTLPHPIHH